MKKNKGKEESVLKKTWEKPKLIILVRGKPEESPLSICKADLIAFPVSIMGNNLECWAYWNPPAAQWRCSSTTNS